MWKKKGKLIQSDNDLWWSQSHAVVPTLQKLKGNLFNLFYSSRDSLGRSYIGYLIIEVIGDHINLIKTCKDPVLNIGERGCFDDNGVTPSCIINN